MAHADRTGAIRFFVTVPSLPRKNESSRSTWKLYEVQFRVVSPSLWSIGIFRFATIERWQPKQVGVHDVWQVKQVIELLACASFSPDVAAPHVPSFWTVFA